MAIAIIGGKMIKKFLLALCLVMCLSSCRKRKPYQPIVKITPVEFPADTGVPDFKYPESQETIYSWLNAENDDGVAKHAWGIWAGLTKPTDQSYDGQKLRVFETWLGVKELSDSVGKMDQNAGCNVARENRNSLNKIKQFSHAGLIGDPIDSSYAILETVSYSPSAACFSSQNLLFNKSSLDKFIVQNGIGKIPDFPVTSITTKPTYYVTKSHTGLVRVPSWTTTPVPAKVFGNKSWDHFVYVDLDNGQLSNKKLIPVVGDNPTEEQIEAATCNLNDFIYFKLDANSAIYLNQHQDQGTDPDHQFHSGDVALLVAMHVTTKEIPNWTWQTYFWAADPANPGGPSSPTIAYLKPSEITGSAAHYAVSPCYAMVYPNQPVTGGKQGKNPIICYNPYLEAGFGPSVFQFKNSWKPEFQYGVQTNCASCHALSTSSGKLGYSTDQYIDMKSPVFKNEVQLDFAWSIQGNLNTDK
jgi:hypothetical protein